MHSPITSTLRGKDIAATAAVTTAATTTCQVDVDVAARATQSLLDAFNADPINAVQEEIMVATGTPVLDINPDNPYYLNCSTDVAYMRIDTENLNEHCEQVTCCCEIRPISGEFRIHLIGDDYAVVDTRNTDHLLQPWVLCSRNADLTLRYQNSRTNTPFVHKAANHIYAPLPQLVEDYVTNTLQRTVLDGRAITGAITSNTEPDVLPFELSLDDYLTAKCDFDVFNEYIATVRDSAKYTICWDHYGCGDNTTYIDTHCEINTAMALPAELVAAAASHSSAAELSRRLFSARTTKNVVRAVGQAPSLGALACALALITDDTPPDWIANIIGAVNDYCASTRTQYDLEHDVAASMATALALIQPYIVALDTRSYTRMLKPLVTGKISFAEQLLACAGGDCSDINNPYNLNAAGAYCAISAARPTSLHYNDVIRDIHTTATRTLGEYIRACGKAVGDIHSNLHRHSDTRVTPLSITAFLLWSKSPAGKKWKRDYDSADTYFSKALNTYVYTQLVERLDGMVIPDINVQLHLARSTAEYISLGTTLSNCIKDYTYKPENRSIIAICETGTTSKPVAAMELSPHTNINSMINQLYAKANSPYRYTKHIRELVSVEADTLRVQLRAQD